MFFTDQTILLCGFMGSGKTTLLELLKKTGPQGVLYRDLDEAIVKTTPYPSVGEIIEAQGERAFRALEERVLKELVGGEEGAIIALGGGVIHWPQQRGVLTVWLDRPFEECWKHIQKDEGTVRPLARRGEKFLQELYQKRRRFYAKADIRFDQLSLKRITGHGQFIDEINAQRS